MSERFKIIDDNLWDLEKSEILLTGKKLGFFQIPYIHGYSVCDILNELNQSNRDLNGDIWCLKCLLDSQVKTHDGLFKDKDELDKLFIENKILKDKNECLQKQLDCTNKNYTELSRRYYSLQYSDKLRTDDPLPDASLEKRLIDCKEHLKKMQSERDIYKNKYENLLEEYKDE